MDVKRIEAIARNAVAGSSPKLFSYPFSKNFQSLLPFFLSSFLSPFYLSSNRSMGRYFEEGEITRASRRDGSRKESRPSLLYPSKMLLIPGTDVATRILPESSVNCGPFKTFTASN